MNIIKQQLLEIEVPIVNVKIKINFRVIAPESSANMAAILTNIEWEGPEYFNFQDQSYMKMGEFDVGDLDLILKKPKVKNNVRSNDPTCAQ